MANKTLRTCEYGHRYYKSSDCPTCPVCENNRKPEEEFLAILSSPARRALENKGIDTEIKLSELSESEILNLHGMGPASLPKLRNALNAKGLKFRDNA